MTRRKKNIQFKLRVQEPLRNAIERAAKGRAVSTNQQAVELLEWAITVDRMFGGQRDLVDAVVSAMSQAGEHAAFDATLELHDAGKWRSNPYAYDHALRAATTVLEAFRPPGPVVPPPPRDVAPMPGETAEEARRWYEQLRAQWGEATARGLLTKRGVLPRPTGGKIGRKSDE